MSRGPGRIERAIRELFDAHPDLAFVTDELAEHCYPDDRPIERKHQISVLRAAWHVIKDDPDWRVLRSEGMGGGWVFFNKANVQSFTLGRIIADSFYIYRSESRARRRAGQWVRIGPGMRAKLTEDVANFVPDRGALLTMLDTGEGLDWVKKKHIAEGVYAAQVADHVAWRDGDAATRAAIEARREEELQAWLEAGRRFAAARRSKCYQAPAATGNETLNPDLGTLADRLRALIVQNDPDAVRTGLREIADALDQLGGREAPVLAEAAD